jgi:hypothetical protein
MSLSEDVVPCLAFAEVEVAPDVLVAAEVVVAPEVVVGPDVVVAGAGTHPATQKTLCLTSPSRSPSS